MAAAVGGKKGGAKAEINITPLVDVVLVLLIIFMVISPGDSTYLPNAIPKISTHQEDQIVQNDQIMLELFANGKARLNQKEVEHGQFLSELNTILENRVDKKIFFSAENEVPYGEIVNWMGLAKKAGASLMAIKISEPTS